MADKQLELGTDNAYIALTNAWQNVLDVMQEHVNKPSFESWLKPTHPISFENGVVRLGTTSKFAKNWIASKLLPQIKEILDQHLSMDVKVKVELITKEAPIIVETAGILPKKPIKTPKAIDEPISLPLNREYNFDSFVIGTNNRLAHACSMAVSQTPGGIYNPLFLYGGAGLGKTHLMHAVGQMVAQTNPDLKFVYVSGEAFTSHYIASVREHRTEEFRKRCRNVDVWLVDDVQFLAGKERTEEEFFHTYNALYDMGKQIVLTSDRAPKELELDNRLLSRFECGMLADIRPPDLETRMAILESKAIREKMTLPDEVILYIARLITSNIRQLEGALIKLHAYASLFDRQISSSFAEEILGNYYTENKPQVIDCQKIQEIVAEKFGVSVSELVGSGRNRDIVTPRQIAMHLCKELTDSSLPTIGKAFGGRDHSTVVHACKQVESKQATDKNYASLVEEIQRKIEC